MSRRCAHPGEPQRHREANCARRRRHGIDVTFDADNLGIDTDVIEKVVSNPARKFAIVCTQEADGLDILRPADEANQGYAARVEPRQHAVEGIGMRRRQHDGVGAFVERACKQSALLLHVVPLIGHIVRDGAPKALSNAVGAEPCGDVGGIGPVLGEHSQPVCLGNETHLAASCKGLDRDIALSGRLDPAPQRSIGQRWRGPPPKG